MFFFLIIQVKLTRVVKKSAAFEKVRDVTFSMVKIAIFERGNETELL